MKIHRLFTIQLLWLSFFLNPAIAQIQPAVISQDSVQLIRTDSAIILAPADTVLPGQKKPFVKAQRVEGDNKAFLKRAVIPSAFLITAGIYTMQGNGIISSFDLRDARNSNFAEFSTKADDYLLFIPLAYMYGLNLFSSQNRHETSRQTVLLIASGALASAFVWPTKVLTDIDRPNGEDHAFPSGHTAYAFTIATIVDKEFRHKSPWISVGSYTIASATGAMRILNNKHWFSDVLAGAGVGILSVNTAYWVHAKLTKGKGLNTTYFTPTLLPNGRMGMAMGVTF
ncbi:phosphatase PAP2 family protein [Pontibacter arcticus]|uniref:PAP2 family protein n=1 Tax=Pontibacter arcticus TaxID=2080288 RepID=A0A364RJJ9_9BACT|nr:phosphatase PAP2 family protein [Pontibacter arcticus]RAU84418.1 PAP2 family protein [Pontibacter arcticus]